MKGSWEWPIFLVRAEPGLRGFAECVWISSAKRLFVF